MFISIYFSLFFILLYLRNKKDFFSVPPVTKIRNLSMVVPCYNEEKDIGNTIDALLKSQYVGLKKIYVVDDCSKDNSYAIIKEYAKKYPGKIIALQTPKNTGCAAGSKNYGAQFVKTELIGFTDADSFPEPDAIDKIVGYFDNREVAAAMGSNLVKNKKTFFERLQAVEYSVISWTRKLLNYVDAIYVTPGPLTIYRTDIFNQVGKFDATQMTEDIELTWRLAYHGYKREMSPSALTYTTVPSTLKQWYNQRIRWNLGGLQCMKRYSNVVFRKGMLGAFILPFFVVSLFLGFTGLSIFTYLFVTRILRMFFLTRYSFIADTAVITLESANITPSVLNFFGVALFLLGWVFTIWGLSVMKQYDLRRQNLLNIFGYLIVYLSLYPFIMIPSMVKFLRGKYGWGTR